MMLLPAEPDKDDEAVAEADNGGGIDDGPPKGPETPPNEAILALEFRGPP